MSRLIGEPLLVECLTSNSSKYYIAGYLMQGDRYYYLVDRFTGMMKDLYPTCQFRYVRIAELDEMAQRQTEKELLKY